MPLTDKAMNLLWIALLALGIGGVLSMLLGVMLGELVALTGFGEIVSLVIILALLLVIESSTAFDEYKIFDILLLLVAIALLGSVIVPIFPMAAPYLLSTSASLSSITSLAFTFVYIGLAIWIADKLGLV